MFHSILGSRISWSPVRGIWPVRLVRNPRAEFTCAWLKPRQNRILPSVIPFAEGVEAHVFAPEGAATVIGAESAPGFPEFAVAGKVRSCWSPLKKKNSFSFTI